jgi:hypothetical protein
MEYTLFTGQTISKTNQSGEIVKSCFIGTNSVFIAISLYAL